MSEYQPIIDVTPIEHSNNQAKSSATANNGSHGSSYRAPSWNTASSSGYRTTTGSAGTPPFGTTFVYGTPDTAASKTDGSVISGLAQMVVGTGLIMIGIPMLILPGPGLLSIAGGFALAANGARKIFA